MTPKERIIIALFAVMIVVALSIPFWGLSFEKEEKDVYSYQTLNGNTIYEVNGPLGKYVMSVTPYHSGNVIIQEKDGTERVPYVCTTDPPMTGLGYTYMEKGKTYVIYFDKEISPDKYQLLLHWKD